MDPFRPIGGRLLRRVLGCSRLRRLRVHAIPTSGVCRTDDPREAAVGSDSGRLRAHPPRQANAGLRGADFGAVHVHLPVRRVHCNRQGDGDSLRDGAANPHGTCWDCHRRVRIQRRPSSIPSDRQSPGVDHHVPRGGPPARSFRRRHRGAD